MKKKLSVGLPLQEVRFVRLGVNGFTVSAASLDCTVGSRNADRDTLAGVVSRMMHDVRGAVLIWVRVDEKEHVYKINRWVEFTDNLTAILAAVEPEKLGLSMLR